MNDTGKEEKLISLLEVRRTDEFWAEKKEAILAAARPLPAVARTWLLVPAAALAMVLVLVLSRVPKPEPAAVQQPVSVAFLEHLDFLDDMDVLEAISEDEL